MWAPFVAWLRLKHAAYTSVSNKDVSVKRLSSFNSRGGKIILLQTALVFPVGRVFFFHAAHRPHTHSMSFPKKTWDP